mmetsp:Transcript_10839/g.24630  ORF Transcript_10839/g.24630 Transcript_10839/m.24630 type:complete len:83 (-) Transcript_10839:413-661(-)
MSKASQPSCSVIILEKGFIESSNDGYPLVKTFPLCEAHRFSCYPVRRLQVFKSLSDKARVCNVNKHQPQPPQLFAVTQIVKL